MSTRFKLYTTVDITATGARKGEGHVPYSQQQNYMTVVQTIGMRVNPIVKKNPQIVEHTKFKNNKVWQLEFEIESEGATDISTLQLDFNLVPFISGLEETQKFEHAVFITDEKNCNILFDIDK